jgi:murein hydrolase activator
MWSLHAAKVRGRLARVRSARWVLVLCLLPWVAPTAAAPSTSSTRNTENQLRTLKSEIERVTRQVTAQQLKRDRLAQELRNAEELVNRARQALEVVQRERAEGATQRTALIEEKHGREGALAHDRGVLASQLRAAYVTGAEEPLKLLLDQKDPTLAGRLFIDYSYFGQARARQIELVEIEVHQLDRLAGALATQDRKLADLEEQQRTQVANLEEARVRRSQVLASLEAESRSREKLLERLRNQQAGLEKLLQELRQAVVRFPVESHDAFAQLRGKLAWPVHGAELLARFGESRAGGLKWDGLLLGTELGEPVRAVYQGRVVYADWLPGLGLLTIIDHGDGYMSLYGHNQQLYKGVGERVSAGDQIASAGDSGGSDRPELYFEIRKSGKPVDPRPWFQSGNP